MKLNAALLVGLLILSAPVFSQVSSDFSANADGWSSNGLGNIVTYNAGGYVTGQDFSTGTIGVFPVYWFFTAPAKYTGDLSAYYNGSLAFDLQEGGSSTYTQTADIIITNSAGVSLFYYNISPQYPAIAPAWSSYNIALNELSGKWKTSNSSTGVSATQADIQNVLGSVTSLRIRGRYDPATSFGALDNVLLSPFKVNTQPSGQTLCAGPIIQLNTGAVGNGLISFQWQVFNTAFGGWVNLTNVAPYSGVTSTNLNINTAAGLGAGSYRCKISILGAIDLYSLAVTVVVNLVPTAPTTTNGSACTGNTVDLNAAGGLAGQYRWYTLASGGTAIPLQTNSLYTTPVLSTTTIYYVSINNGVCESTRIPVTAVINSLPTAPTPTGGASCTPAALLLSATGGSAGQYRWYTVPVGGGPISGQTSNTYTTPLLSVTTTYYVSIFNGTCESSRVPVVAQINTPPAAPTTTTGAASCSPATLTVSATGGSPGQYVWYTVATGGTGIPGETNSSYTTPLISVTTTYYVAINNGTCESTRKSVVAQINTPPAAPATTIGAANCTPAALTLSATGGSAGQYVWYTVATGGTAIPGAVNSTYTTPLISATTTYYVAINNGTCESGRKSVIAQINTPPAAPTTTTGASSCSAAALLVSATGGSAGQYVWYTVATGGTGIPGQTNSSYTTPVISVSTTYYVAINNGTCESTRKSVIAQINTPPASPTTTTGASSCSPATLTLSANGGSAGQYVWYTVSTGGTGISGAVNSTYITPLISTTTTYYVAISNGTCESTRKSVIAQINTPPAAPATTTGSSSCSPAALTLSATGGSAGQYVWYTVATGGTGIFGATNNTYTTPLMSVSTTYYVSINNGTCESTRKSVVAKINTPPAAPTTAGARSCSSSALLLAASGGSSGQYRWYTTVTGGLAISGTTSATYLTPVISVTTNYYTSINNGSCESNRTLVVAKIDTPPSAPVVNGAIGCSPSSVSLTANGGSAGQYRWYTSSTGGADVGEFSGNYQTPVLSTTTTYFVSINNGSCESARVPAQATINDTPSAPTVTGASGCTSTSLTISASGGSNGQYRWYTSASGGTALAGSTNGNFVTPSLQLTTTFYVAINNGSCESIRVPVVADVRLCNNSPVITATDTKAAIGGVVSISLTALLSDPDDNLDLSTLKVLVAPLSGAVATIDSQYNLTVDYTGNIFSGKDQLTIQVCDVDALCAQQQIEIDVSGDLEVYNGFSPNGDGKNDFFIIANIEAFEDTKENHVSIFSRWGDVVFECDNYDNKQNVFKGISKNGAEVGTGSYFYKIEFKSGRKALTGYVSLRR